MATEEIRVLYADPVETTPRVTACCPTPFQVCKSTFDYMSVLDGPSDALIASTTFTAPEEGNLFIWANVEVLLTLTPANVNLSNSVTIKVNDSTLAYSNYEIEDFSGAVEWDSFNYLHTPSAVVGASAGEELTIDLYGRVAIAVVGFATDIFFYPAMHGMFIPGTALAACPGIG